MGTSAHSKIDTENMPDVSQLTSDCSSLLSRKRAYGSISDRDIDTVDV